MLKNKILQVAVSLFSQYGIKGVSMNQIAGKLQISKKTIYLEFADKEDLIGECLNYEEDRLIKIVKNTEEKTKNSLERLIMNMSNLYYYRSNFCPSFFRDMQRYPKNQDRLLKGKLRLQDLFIHYFHEGIKEGYFKGEFEYEAIAALFIEQLGDWDNMHQPYIFLTFLRGICTEKGNEILETLSPNKSLKINSNN